MTDDSSTSPEYAYDAFISYSHADIVLAKRLSQRIRRYRPPRKMELARRRLVPFRDVEQLTVSGDLTDTLVERLEASRVLIVLCSPAAAESTYVTQEIEVFLKRHDLGSIHLVLCSGESETSIPKVLRQVLEKPLFVDLRQAQAGLSGYRRFRAETLRMIAALYGVDYSKLAREDESRRRRLRIMGSTAALLLAAVLTAGYQITTVEPFAWVDQQLPRTGTEIPSLTYGNPLMPIRDIAFNRQDPAIHIYLVRDAEYHGQKPSNSIFLEPVRVDFDGQLLRSQAERRVEQDVDPDAGPTALAEFRFNVKNQSGVSISKGASHLFLTGLDPDGHPRLHQVLGLRHEQPDAPVWRHLISTTSLTSDFSPVRQWPTEKLVDAGLLPLSGSIEGIFQNQLDGTETPVEFQIIDAMDLFIDAIGPERFDTLLATNDADLEVLQGGTLIRLSDIDQEIELWPELIRAQDWVAHSKPASSSFPIRTFRAAAQGEVPGLPKDDVESITTYLGSSGIGNMEWGSVDLVSRLTSGGIIRAATLVGQTGHGIAYGIDTSEEIRRVILFDGIDDEVWRTIRVPATRRDSRVLDIVTLDESGTRLLLVLSGEGLMYSSDSGHSWQDFNLGEKRLATVGAIKVVTMGPEFVYALVDNDLKGDGSRENFLFRLQQRDWRDRLRLGLKTWLPAK